MAHVILICEAGSLKLYEKYLADFGWTNAENLLLPSWTWGRRKYPTDCRTKGRLCIKICSGQKRKVSYAISELERGKAISRKEFAASCRGYFYSSPMTHAGWLQHSCQQ